MIKKIIFDSLTSDGESREMTTRNLTAVFKPGLPNLTRNNFAIDGADIVKVAVVSHSEEESVYNIAIENITKANGRLIAVSVAQSISENYGVWNVRRYAPVWVREVSWEALEANGASEEITTTELTLGFSSAVNLSESDFEIPEGATIVSLYPCGHEYEPPTTPAAEEEEEQGGNSSLNFLGRLVNGVTSFIDGVKDRIMPTVNDQDTSTPPATLTAGQEVASLEAVLTKEGAAEPVQEAPAEAEKEKAAADARDSEGSTCWKMEIALDPEIVNGTTLTVRLAREWTTGEDGFIITPTSKDVEVYVHVKKNNWVQATNSRNTPTLGRSGYTTVAMSVPYTDDSLFAHLGNGGIIIDQPGDYEVSISVYGSANKEGGLYFTLGNGISWAEYVLEDVVFNSTKTVIIPNRTRGMAFNLQAKSQFNTTQLTMDAAQSFMSVKYLGRGIIGAELEQGERAIPESLPNRQQITALNEVDTAYDARLDTLEGTDASHSGRLETLEGTDTAYDERLDNLEGTDADHGARISALEGDVVIPEEPAQPPAEEAPPPADEAVAEAVR
ncbi:MAG: hypothetical protein LBM01_04090 [Christensenellaceae bacterium]|jgi:hypothetical protein|nr:hypothetical protein [Christensenellaceae bacterium]